MVSLARPRSTHERSHVEVLHCLEELAHLSASKRHHHTCSRIVDALASVADSMPQFYRDKSADIKSYEHPLRQLQGSVGRIAETFAVGNVPDSAHQMAWVIRDLARAFDRAHLSGHLDVDVSGSIGRLNRACAVGDHESAIYNFWANMSYVFREWMQQQLITRSRLPLFVLDQFGSAFTIVADRSLHSALYQMTTFLADISEAQGKATPQTSTRHGDLTLAVNMADEILKVVSHATAVVHRCNLGQYVGRFGHFTTAHLLDESRRALETCRNAQPSAGGDAEDRAPQP